MEAEEAGYHHALEDERAASGAGDGVVVAGDYYIQELASDDTDSNHTSGIEEVLLLDKWRRLGVRIRRKRAPSLRSTLKAMTLKAMAALQEEKELREAERHALKFLGVCSATAFWQTADPALVAEMDADALRAEREIAIEQGRLPPLGAALPLASGHAVDKSGGAFTTRQEELYALQDVAAGLQKDAKAGLELDHSSVAEDSSGDSSNDSSGDNSGDNSGDSSNDSSNNSSNGGGEDHAAIMEKDGDGDVEDKEVEDEGVDDDEAKDEEVEDEEPKYEEAMDRATPQEKAGDDQHEEAHERNEAGMEEETGGCPEWGTPRVANAGGAAFIKAAAGEQSPSHSDAQDLPSYESPWRGATAGPPPSASDSPLAPATPCDGSLLEETSSPMANCPDSNAVAEKVSMPRLAECWLQDVSTAKSDDTLPMPSRETRGAMRHLGLTIAGGPPQLLAVCSVAELGDVLRYASMRLDRWPEAMLRGLYCEITQQSSVLFSRRLDADVHSWKMASQGELWLEEFEACTPTAHFRTTDTPAAALAPLLCPNLLLKRRSLTVQLLSPEGDLELVLRPNSDRSTAAWLGNTRSAIGSSVRLESHLELARRLGKALIGNDSPSRKAMELAVHELCLRRQELREPGVPQPDIQERDWRAVCLVETDGYPGLECQRVHYVVQLETSGLPLGDFTSDPGGEVRHWEWVPTMDVATVLERGGTSSPRAACVPPPVTVTPPSAQRFLSNEHMAIASVSPASMGAVSIKPCIKFSALAASVSTPSLPKHAQEAALSKEADHLQQPVAIPKAPRPSRSLQTLKLKQRSRQKPVAVEGMLRRPVLLKRHSPHPLAAMSPELALDGGRHVPTMSAHPVVAIKSFAAAAQFGRVWAAQTEAEHP